MAKPCNDPMMCVGCNWPLEECRGKCDVCGETLDGEIAEMVNPNEPYQPNIGREHYMVHAECGLQAGMEIA